MRIYKDLLSVSAGIFTGGLDPIVLVGKGVNGFTVGTADRPCAHFDSAVVLPNTQYLAFLIEFQILSVEFSVQLEG
jgi:hypothetical protein